MIVDLFAGPGGWSEGLRLLSPELHREEIGLEWDAAACATRAAAGHRTVRTDISVYPVERFKGAVGVIASPPCQDFSVAGNRLGLNGTRGQLVHQVVRWVEQLQPQWVVCEQVTPVLPIWELFAEKFNTFGYHCWVGVLNAADYGVPQTRKRAFLIGSKTGFVHRPEPSHHRTETNTLFGVIPAWVTLQQALGWDVVDSEEWWVHRPSTTIVGSFRPDIVAGPGVDLTVPRQNRKGSVQITEQEGLILQTFDRNYPVQGSKTKRWQQIGNAVPPLLAAHVLSVVTGHELKGR